MVKNPVERVLCEGVVVGLANHTLLIARDGTERPIADSGAPIRDEQGTITGVVLVFRDQTEERAAQRALKESEERYRTLVEESFDGIFIQKGSKITFANRPLSEMLGYNRGELEGKDHWLVYHPDYQKLTRERANARMRGEAVPSQYQVKLQRKDGSSFDGEVLARRIMFGDDPGIQVWVRDITERKRAEEELSKSEEETKRLVQENAIMAEISRIISSTLDIDQVYETFAKEVQKLIPFDRISISIVNLEKGTGISTYMTGKEVPDRQVGIPYPLEGTALAEMIRNTSTFLIQTEDPNEVRVHFPKLVSTFEAGFRSIMDVPLFSKGQIIGGLLFRSMKPYAYGDRDVKLAERVSHQIAGAIANAQLFIERKKTEDALRKSEERFRNIAEASSEYIWETDAQARYSYATERMEAIYGRPLSDIVGHKPFDFMPPEEARRIRKLMSESAHRKQPFRNLEHKTLRPDGTVFWQQVSGIPMFNKDGDVSGYRGTASDITERKRAEQEMAALQEQLRQSQKMEAIGQLAGGIAHDFNNLLTIISGSAQLSLLDLQEGDPLKTNLEEIRRASDRAADLTRQLLAFSRKQILEMKVLDLNQILGKLDKMLRRVIGEDIALEVIPAELLGKVKADPGQIEQVLMNLAVNARDAMPEGGKLTIETANVELDEEYARRHIAVKPGSYVMLSVSDTGMGMTPEVKERLFEPFFTTKEMGKGTGLGLSTVYGIVKQSGGNIWVYSEPGQGTTFKVYLPQVDEPLEELREEEIREIPRGSETVLVVEDEETVRKLAVRILKRQGYKVLEAEDGGKAFMLCEKYKEPIHLILTDVVMPGMSGRKLAERLKEIHPEAKVLYMSGYTDNAILHHGVLEPGIQFLQKPFTVEGLSRKVREALDK
jgi:PAS domain S-box-containing protein